MHSISPFDSVRVICTIKSLSFFLCVCCVLGWLAGLTALVHIIFTFHFFPYTYKLYWVIIYRWSSLNMIEPATFLILSSKTHLHLILSFLTVPIIHLNNLSCILNMLFHNLSTFYRIQHWSSYSCFTNFPFSTTFAWQQEFIHFIHPAVSCKW